MANCVIYRNFHWVCL